MSDRRGEGGAPQTPGGPWQPPERAHAPLRPPLPPSGQLDAERDREPAPTHDAPTEAEPIATRTRGGAPSDAAGALLVVVGILGGIAWAWEVVRTQFVVDVPESPGVRIDVLAGQIPVLLLSAAVAGVGIGLRTLASTRTGTAARSALDRTVGWMLLVAAAALTVLLGGAAIFGDDDTTEPSVPRDVWANIDEMVTLDPPTTTATRVPELTHTLEVHTDGCGVVRSGEIGDDLT